MVGDILYFILMVGLGVIIGIFLGMYLGIKKFIIDQLPGTGSTSERIKSYLKNDIIPMVKEEATDFVDNKLKPEAEAFVKEKVVPEAKNLFEKKIKPVLTSKVVDPMKKYAAKELSKIQGEVISKIEDTVNGPIKETIKSTISESLKDPSSLPKIVRKTSK